MCGACWERRRGGAEVAEGRRSSGRRSRRGEAGPEGQLEGAGGGAREATAGPAVTRSCLTGREKALPGPPQEATSLNALLLQLKQNKKLQLLFTTVRRQCRVRKGLAGPPRQRPEKVPGLGEGRAG